MSKPVDRRGLPAPGFDFNRKFVNCFVFTLALLALEVQAQDPASHPMLEEDWLFRAGGQYVETDMNVGLFNDRTGGIPVVDLKALGMDTTFTGFWANVIWQAPERWHLGLTYFDAKGEGDSLTQEEIRFGDLLIPAGTGVAGDYGTKFYILNASYDFFHRPDRIAGVGLGLYSLDLDITLEALVDNQPSGRSSTADTLAPLPTASLYYRQAFTDRWALMADLGYFSTDYSKYDGRILTGRVSLEYWFDENWGVGGGYSLLDIELTVDEQRYDERYDAKWGSFFLFLTAGF